jgi:hypothetical protein
VKEIIIDVSEEGEVKIETRGFKGQSCVTEAQYIKDVLGKEIARQLTPAYYQEEPVCIKKHLPLCG